MFITFDDLIVGIVSSFIAGLLIILITPKFKHVSKKISVLFVFLVLIVGFLGTIVIREVVTSKKDALENEIVNIRLGIELVDLNVVANLVCLTFEYSNNSQLDLVLISLEFNISANEYYVGHYEITERIPLDRETDSRFYINIKLIPHYVKTLTGSDETTLESFLDGSGEIQWWFTGSAVVELVSGDGESFNVSVIEAWHS